MTGSGDKKIAIWDLHQPSRDKSITPIHKLDAKAFGALNVVTINPRSALLATASTELVTHLFLQKLTPRYFGCQTFDRWMYNSYA